MMLAIGIGLVSKLVDTSMGGDSPCWCLWRCTSGVAKVAGSANTGVAIDGTILVSGSLSNSISSSTLFSLSPDPTTCNKWWASKPVQREWMKCT